MSNVLPAWTGPDRPADMNEKPGEPTQHDCAAQAEITTLLEALYRSESRTLMRSVARGANGSDEAQDLVQETFLRLARLRGRALDLERPQAFLKRVASNLLKDRAREAVRKQASPHISLDVDCLAGCDPARLLESRDMLNRIEAAMMRLRPKTREIFMAHRIDGLSYAEIAQRTGLSVKGVEKQMSKALQKLDRLVNR